MLSSCSLWSASPAVVASFYEPRIILRVVQLSEQPLGIAGAPSFHQKSVNNYNKPIKCNYISSKILRCVSCILSKNSEIAYSSAKNSEISSAKRFFPAFNRPIRLKFIAPLAILKYLIGRFLTLLKF